ncbi:MAG: glycosyltransferase family 39 protein [Saprospiraceae bacterium]|nr:glycosyltransferase family 39 protein [Saprospiraceae bacterium]
MKNERLQYSLLFAALGAIFYIPFLGGVHLFDWDEVNFAEISREMLVLDEYLQVHVNFDPFWEKPPFFFWLQALGMAVFGVGEFAARLPNAICGVLTLVLLFNIGKTIKDTRFGIIWAGTYFGSILPFLYFKSGIIDPWFNLFIFLGLYFFILSYWKREKTEGITLNKSHWFYLLIGGLMIGLGILTKGPVAYLIAALTMAVYWVYQRFRFYVNVPHFLFFTLISFAIAAIWYGSFFIDQFEAFNKYQYRLLSTPDAGHKGFPGYHFAVVLVGCFPASIFAIRSFFKGVEQKSRAVQDFTIWMKFLFWVVLILFTIVKSKIVHYSSMSYYPLTFLAALIIYNIIEGNITLNRWMRIGLWTTASLYLIVVFALPYAGFNIELIKPLFSKDAFALANLEAQVHWTGWEVLPGIALLALMIFFMRMVLKGNRMQGFAVLFGGTAIFVMLTLFSFVKRIEGYSQRAAVEFFESKANEDCYLMTYGYKSYVHLFYGKPQNGNKCCFKEEACTQKLLHEPLDKPAYIVTKITKVNELKDLPGMIEIGRKNGFVFFKRE